MTIVVKTLFHTFFCFEQNGRKWPKMLNSLSSRKQTPSRREKKKMSVVGAGCLQECENTEFVWEFLNRMGFD